MRLKTAAMAKQMVLQRWLLPGDEAGGVSAQDLAIGDTEEANANEWYSPGNGVVN